jgi:hypothetical protein
MVSEAYADMKLVNAMIDFAWFILPCILQYIFFNKRSFVVNCICYLFFLVLPIHILYFAARILASYVVNSNMELLALFYNYLVNYCFL